MIDQVLRHIESKLRGEFSGIETIEMIHPKEIGNKEGLFGFLLNVSEEATLKNSSRIIKKEGKTKYKEPSVYLNVLVLLTYKFDYITGLQHLSNTIRYFQKNKLLLINDGSGGNQIKMSVELQDITIEQLNQIWSIAGGYLYPSLLYKIRVAEIAVNEMLDAPEIKEIQMGINKLN